MNWDYGSRDPQFLQIVKEIREKLLEISHVNAQTHTTVLMQGSGTFGVEATLGTTIPKKNHKLLIVANGAYGERMAKIATILNLNHIVLRYKDNEVVKNGDVSKIILKNMDSISNCLNFDDDFILISNSCGHDSFGNNIRIN
jgi:2-aminoethylphosphonate-pyruvate transaminase